MNFGNVHVGAAATQALSITNTALADGFSEKLDRFRKRRRRGNATASGSSTLLGPTATNNSSLVVGIDTSSAGHKSGTGSITLTSDGTGTSGLGNTALSSQTVNVSGDVYRLASASAHTPEPVNFGNVHVGAAATQALSITNTALADGFSEKLDASLGGATGNATASGSFTLLGPTATNNSSLVVGIDTSSAGHKSGTGSITLTSNGTGTSGLGNTALTSQTVNVSGDVYNLASSSTIGAIAFGLRHVGDGTITRLLTITNTAPGGAFSEGLDSSFGAFSGTGGSRISTSGSITNLIAGATDSSSMSITLDTSTVGNVNGTQAVHQASNGTISGLGNTALADQNGVRVTGYGRTAWTDS